MKGAMLCKRICHNCVPQTGSLSQDNMQAVTAQRSNNVVAQRMDLLQHNLDVQALVVSLPRDPAIWKAFVKNEKVRSLCNLTTGSCHNLKVTMGKPLELATGKKRSIHFWL